MCGCIQAGCIFTDMSGLQKMECKITQLKKDKYKDRKRQPRSDATIAELLEIRFELEENTSQRYAR